MTQNFEIYNSIKNRFFIFCVVSRETQGLGCITLDRANIFKICSDRVILIKIILLFTKRMKQIGPVLQKLLKIQF